MGLRPSHLFLVESGHPFAQMPVSYFLAWKESATLLWSAAGFEASLRPSTNAHETTDPSTPNVDSIVSDLHTAPGLSREVCTLRAWDVSAHVGYYHPRIRRPEIYQQYVEAERATIAARGLHAELASSIAAAQLLFDDLDEVLATIEPMQTQLTVYGHKPRLLLLVACMEVESALQSVLSCNSAKPPRSPTMKEYAQLARPMKLSDWTVRLVRSTEVRVHGADYAAASNEGARRLRSDKLMARAR